MKNDENNSFNKANSKGKKILIALAFIVAFVAFYLIKISTYGIKEIELYNNGYGMLDMRLHYSTDLACKIIEELGNKGREVYSRVLIYDFFFTIGFAVVHVTILKYIIKLLQLDVRYQKIAYLAFLRGALDLIEDALLSTSFRIFPSNITGIIEVTSVITTLKWIAMISSWILPFLIVIIVQLNKMRKRVVN